MISRLNPTLAYLIGAASVLTGLGLGLLWTPADRLLLNPYRFWSVSQVCDLKGEKTLLGADYPITRYDETVAGTVDIYSLCETPFYSFPIPSIDSTAVFMLSILISVLFVSVLLFKDKASRLFLTVPILLAGISGVGIWQSLAMSEPNLKSEALAMASGYLSNSGGWSEPALREQLACCDDPFTKAEIDYALGHVKVDWSLQAYKKAKQLLSIYPDLSNKNLQSALLREGYELPFIQVALAVMQLEEKYN